MLDLELIKARERAATEGPWITAIDDDNIRVEAISEDDQWIFFTEWFYGSPKDDPDTCAEYEQAIRNYTFAAHARVDVPAMVKEIEELRGFLKEALDVLVEDVREELERTRKVVDDHS